MTSRDFVIVLVKMRKLFAFLFSSRETYYHQNRKIVGRKELRITGRRLEEAFRLPMPITITIERIQEVNSDYRVICKDNRGSVPYRGSTAIIRERAGRGAFTAIGSYVINNITVIQPSTQKFLLIRLATSHRKYTTDSKTMKKRDRHWQMKQTKRYQNQRKRSYLRFKHFPVSKMRKSGWKPPHQLSTLTDEAYSIQTELESGPYGESSEGAGGGTAREYRRVEWEKKHEAGLGAGAYI